MTCENTSRTTSAGATQQRMKMALSFMLLWTSEKNLNVEKESHREQTIRPDTDYRLRDALGQQELHALEDDH